MKDQLLILITTYEAKVNALSKSIHDEGGHPRMDVPYMVHTRNIYRHVLIDLQRILDSENKISGQGSGDSLRIHAVGLPEGPESAPLPDTPQSLDVEPLASTVDDGSFVCSAERAGLPKCNVQCIGCWEIWKYENKTKSS